MGLLSGNGKLRVDYAHTPDVFTPLFLLSKLLLGALSCSHREQARANW